jgi:hypothetical protein
MKDSSGNPFKEKLLTVLGDAETSNAALKKKAQGVAEVAGFAEGLARHYRPIIEQLPNDSALPTQVWTDLTRGWEEQNRLATSAFSVITSAPSSSATTAAATLTTTGSTEMLTAWMPKSRELEALRSYLHRPDQVEKVRSLLRTFGLDRAATGSRSSLDLLDEASAALARPSGLSPGPTAVLIAAREAIQVVLADLLPRRPTQEATGKSGHKVVSIGAQCGRNDLPTDHFERIGRDVARLLDRLSAGKSGALTSDQVTTLFDEVLQFFEAFLESLELARLKSR